MSLLSKPTAHSCLSSTGLNPPSHEESDLQETEKDI